MIARAQHDQVDHLGQHARGIFDRFAAPQLSVVGAQKYRVTAELLHARFERDARSRGRQIENHRERTAAQRLVDRAGFAHPLEFDGAIDEPREFLRAEIEQREEVPGHDRTRYRILDQRDDAVDDLVGLFVGENQRRQQADHACRA